MNLLAIDTSSENISLSIMWKGDILLDFNRRIKFGASLAVSYIEKYFKKFSLNFKKINAFIIGNGPGSFTGLRISFSVIKALAFSLNKPVISLGSFLSCAYPFKDREKKIAVICDARRQLIYAASFKAKDGILKKEGKEKLTNLMEFIEEKDDYFFVTYDKHLREQVSNYNPRINFYTKNVYPKARYLLLLGKKNYEKGKFIPLERLDPLYLYPKTCQIRTI